MGKTYNQLSLEERCQIARFHEDGQSIRKIATIMDRAPSTISRELKRNGAKEYKPVYADEQAWARRWHGSKLECHPALQEYVLNRLAMGWSPEQVAGRMTHDKHSMSVSYETIYRFIYKQYARTQNGKWRLYLPRAKFKRGFRGRKGGSLAKNKERRSIHERPQHVQDRQVFGHWEADLMLFADKKHNLMALLERKSRFAFLSWHTSKHAMPIAKKISDYLSALPSSLRQTITLDNGVEFARMDQVEQETNILAYYCDNAKPWQKGAVENLNARLRRFLPRKTNVNNITADDIQHLQDIINTTPRKSLGFKTPYEVLHQLLHFVCESTFRFSTA